MAYHFSLDALLRVQRSLERQQEQRLLAAASLVAKISNQIEVLDAERYRQKRSVLSRLDEHGSLAELHFASTVDQLALALREKLLAELEKAQEQKKVQMASYRKAHSRTETLASLDAQCRHEYDRLVSRRDQQLADELFLMRQRFGASD